MYSKINDIIQLSSENKITTKNAWSLGVNVDSILETALDEGIVDDKENDKKAKAKGNESRDKLVRRRSGGFGRPGVNFQKASCKLDASVKIYSVRVDDTHASSYRILENLTRTNKGGERGGDPGSDAPDGPAEVGGAKATSNKYALTSTLEKNPANLNAPPSKELAVDPSFHKMSQLFDEGGAQGMLLVNLALDPNRGCRVSFGDAEDPGADKGQTDWSKVGSGLVDVSGLKARFDRAVLQVLGKDAANESSSASDLLSELELCPSLQDFRDEIGDLDPSSAAASAEAAGNEGTGATERGDKEGGGDGGDEEGGGALDLGGGDDGYDSDGCYDDCGEGGGDLRMFDEDDEGGGEEGPGGEGGGCVLANRAAGRGFGAALESALALGVSSDDEYAFFDMKRLGEMNLWAGATHWKFGQKRPTPKPKPAADPQDEDGASGKFVGGAAKKARRGALAVDYSLGADLEAALAAALAPGGALAPAKPAAPKGGRQGKATKASAAWAATLLTSGAVAKSEASGRARDFSLPDDLGLTPRYLTRLATRPNACIRLGPGGPGGGGFPGVGGFVVDAQLSAGQPYHGQLPGGFGGGGENDDDGYGYDGDYGGGGGDDSFDDEGAGGGAPGFLLDPDGADYDAAALLAPDRKVAKIKVRHEVRAKKVDVKELKHQMWTDLEGALAKSPEGGGGASPAEGSPEGGASKPFAQVMSDVEGRQDQANVTLPFYFICVLHLANEHGLKLEGAPDLGDFTISVDA